MQRQGRFGLRDTAQVDDIRCPVPTFIKCRQSEPASEENGVKMICTNKECPFTRNLIHERCFDQLEDYLVTRLKTTSWGRGWTDRQCRDNLWETKGYTLVGKECRCPCGMGVLELDKEARYQKEIAARAATTPRRPRHTTKVLPRLALYGPAHRDEEAREAHDARPKKRAPRSRRNTARLRIESVSSETLVKSQINGLTGGFADDCRRSAWSEYDWQSRGTSSTGPPSISISDFPLLNDTPVVMHEPEWCRHNKEPVHKHSESEDEEVENNPLMIPYKPVPSPKMSPMGFGRGQFFKPVTVEEPAMVRKSAPFVEEKHLTCAELVELVGEWMPFGESPLNLAESILANQRLPGLFRSIHSNLP